MGEAAVKPILRLGFSPSEREDATIELLKVFRVFRLNLFPIFPVKLPESIFVFDECNYGKNFRKAGE
jgi:hypothetical protein